MGMRKSEQTNGKNGRSLTAAQRQALYRERHLESGESVEVRAVLPREFGDKLERLLAHHDTSKRALLMQLIEDADRRTLRRLRGAARRTYENGGNE